MDEGYTSVYIVRCLFLCDNFEIIYTYFPCTELRKYHWLLNSTWKLYQDFMFPYFSTKHLGCGYSLEAHQWDAYYQYSKHMFSWTNKTRIMFRWKFILSTCLAKCYTFLINTQNIGIKHGFSCINICQVPWEVLKMRPEAAVFNTSQGTWRMLMHWKTMFDRYYCIKHLLHFALFLALFCFAFSLMSRERNFHGLYSS